MQITPEVLAAFLADLTQHGKLERAARAVGLSRQSIYRHMNDHPDFAAEVACVRGEARGKPKTAAQLTREACMAVLADEGATHHAKMNAAAELRKIDAEARRQREAREETGRGAPTRSEDPPPVDEAMQALLRAAKVRSTVTILSTMIHMLPLKAAADEFRHFAGLDRELQLACLEHARHPVPLVPADAEAAEIAEPSQPAPDAVVDAMQAIIDGAAVDAVIAELCRSSGFQAQQPAEENEGEACAAFR